MTVSVSSCFITLVVLFLWQIEDIAEACRCAPVHLQQAFATQTSVRTFCWLLSMFKGPDRVIHAIFTSSSASCGVTLKSPVHLPGSLNTDGSMGIGMCNFIRYWDDLNGTQKKSLTQRYRTGCACKIIRCSSLPCPVSAPDECLWTDWLLNHGQSGPQAKYSACLMSFDGSCYWYRGMDPSKK
uniref:Metalloproteinase inhibitor 2 n=1 Tax=Oncorhynchus tshawytscha TaxID=74940 RepID=A0AAZ3PHA2_ONCTS